MMKWTVIALRDDDPWQDHEPVEVWPDHWDAVNKRVLHFTPAQFKIKDYCMAPNGAVLLLGSRVIHRLSLGKEGIPLPKGDGRNTVTLMISSVLESSTPLMHLWSVPENK